MPKQTERPAKPKVTIIPGRGVAQTINYLLEDRDDLEWLVAVGRNKQGEIFFYDTGGDIIEDLGTLDHRSSLPRRPVPRVPEGAHHAGALRGRAGVTASARRRGR